MIDWSTPRYLGLFTLVPFFLASAARADAPVGAAASARPASTRLSATTLPGVTAAPATQPADAIAHSRGGAESLAGDADAGVSDRRGRPKAYRRAEPARG